MLNEGNLIHNFISSSGSDFLTIYSSGSAIQKVMVPTVQVPVPQHCLPLENFWFFYYRYLTWRNVGNIAANYVSTKLIAGHLSVIPHRANANGKLRYRTVRYE
jgi:hypothetical protein